MLKIRKIEKKTSVYDITVEDNNNFFANGILVHNCTEVLLPTTPFKSEYDESGEIGVCVLAAINVLTVPKEDFESVCDIVVRMLDKVIDHQSYPFIQAENACKKRRSIGVGITNFAAYLAKNKIMYSSEASAIEAYKIAEALQYNLLKASNKLAQEIGPCELYHETKYSQGLLPIDHYFKNVDNIYSELHYDWESLRADIKQYGLRNSTLSTQMPVESCVKYSEKIKTHNGDMDFHEICEYGGIDWKMIEDGNSVGWYELQNPISVPTIHGDSSCSHIYYNGYKETLDIELEDGSIMTVTPEHKFLINEYEGSVWKRALDLTKSDIVIRCVNKVLKSIRVAKVSKSKEKTHTWDISVEKYHNYIFAKNNVVTHNSSLTSNSTSGIEPVRSLIVAKMSKSGQTVFVVPNIKKMGKYYEKAFDIKDNKYIINIVAAMQKFFDMSISYNSYYNSEHFNEGRISRTLLIADQMYGYSMGLKTMYYTNTKKPSDTDETSDSGCESGACAI